MTKQQLLTRVDAVLDKGQRMLESVKPVLPGYDYDPEHRWVDQTIAGEFRTAGVSLLANLFGQDHQIFKDVEILTNGKNTLGAYRKPYGLLKSIRQEIENDWLESTRALIAADIFANIIEMADYLLAEGYKDAAAVLVGGSLEGHLRQLATKFKVDTHYIDNLGQQRSKKAESLNHDLHKVNAYSLGDQKQVTAWLDLRNEAAHAHYNSYIADQVKLMSNGVQNFIVRVTA